jgi:diguanylate cyclase (GGDEF)-like protein
VADKQLMGAVLNRVKRSRYLMRRLQYLDQQDPQTGSINQRAMLSHLNTAIDEYAGPQRSVVLLFLDIDWFRTLREQSGFAASELLITNLASMIRLEIGPAEHIARVGNASFVALLPGVSAATAESMSDRLGKVIAGQVFKLGTQSFSISVSIGVAPLTDAYPDADAWFIGAALACEIARSEAINRSYFHQSMSDRQLEQEQHASCARMLREALDSDALNYVYQPIAGLHGDCTAAALRNTTCWYASLTRMAMRYCRHVFCRSPRRKA